MLKTASLVISILGLSNFCADNCVLSGQRAGLTGRLQPPCATPEGSLTPPDMAVLAPCSLCCRSLSKSFAAESTVVLFLSAVQACLWTQTETPSELPLILSVSGDRPLGGPREALWSPRSGPPCSARTSPGSSSSSRSETWCRRICRSTCDIRRSMGSSPSTGASAGRLAASTAPTTPMVRTALV